MTRSVEEAARPALSLGRLALDCGLDLSESLGPGARSNEVDDRRGHLECADWIGRDPNRQFGTTFGRLDDECPNGLSGPTSPSNSSSDSAAAM